MKWDYIIIGAGSAGCVLANRLSKDSNNSVLVLEAGNGDSSLFLKIPTGIGYYHNRKEGFGSLDWGYRSEPDPSRNDRTDAWLRGRVIGGSSSINGQMYVRGSSADYDRWAALGNKGWSAHDIMPLFEALETSDKKSPGRGQKGPLHIRTISNPHPVTKAFVEAAQNAGFSYNPDYNHDSQEGVSYAELTQKGRLRWSSSDAFLKPALGRKNLKVITGAHMQKLLITDRKVTGVRYKKGNKLKQVEAHRVILCAGAISTPQLLMLSGIGDVKELSQLGIKPVIDRPSVGTNLQEHPLLAFTYRLRVPTFNPTEGIRQSLSFVAQYLLKGKGPIATFFEAAAFLKTQPELTDPDIQLHFLPSGVKRPWEGPEVPLLMPYPAVTIFMNKSYPLSRGRIRLASSDPQNGPLIQCKLLENEEDMETMKRGTALVRSIMNSPPMANLIEEETCPAIDYTDPQAMEDFIRNNTELAYHPIGTCRMGVDDDAVVTPDLRVKGIDNLWIADASIMPDLISGNTNGVCIMIGEKLSRLLTGKSS